MKKLNWIGIFVTSLAIGFIVYVNTIMIIGPSEKVDTTEEPISQDSIIGKCLQGVIHWEIWNDTLLIYTEEDSIKDAQKRWEYIQWIENEEEEWKQGVCGGDTIIAIATSQLNEDDLETLQEEQDHMEWIEEGGGDSCCEDDGQIEKGLY